jgi:CDP-paratose 2-epimerase
LNDSPDSLIETNFTGTYNILEFAQKVHAKLLFLSTIRVYSIPSLDNLPYKETNSRFVIDASYYMMGLSNKRN